jgi:hypothetical protein
MQPKSARQIVDLSGDELEMQLEVTWSTLSKSAARWRMLRDEARQRIRQQASEALAEMVERRLPPIKRRGMDELLEQMKISKPKEQLSGDSEDAA